MEISGGRGEVHVSRAQAGMVLPHRIKQRSYSSYASWGGSLPEPKSSSFTRSSRSMGFDSLPDSSPDLAMVEEAKRFGREVEKMESG